MTGAVVTPADVGHHYDELDGFYQELWGLHVHHGLWTTGQETPREATDALTDHIANLAEISSGDRICDVGCGYGETARKLVRERGVEVTGFTVSAVQHAKAVAETPGDNPRFLHCDWLGNELPSESCDAVIAIESISHIADRRKVFAEAFRVLKPGGRLVLCDWLRGDHMGPLERRFLIEPICREGRLPALDRARDYIDWIEEAGFRFEDTEDVSRRVDRTWSLVIRNVLDALAKDPKARRYLLDKAQKERSFALSPLRLLIAFRTGAFRYVIFKARKPAG